MKNDNKCRRCDGGGTILDGSPGSALRSLVDCDDCGGTGRKPRWGCWYATMIVGGLIPWVCWILTSVLK